MKEFINEILGPLFTILLMIVVGNLLWDTLRYTLIGYNGRYSIVYSCEDGYERLNQSNSILLGYKEIKDLKEGVKCDVVSFTKL